MSNFYSSATARSPKAAEQYVGLTFDKSVLLFKQRDIYSFESLVDVDADSRKSNSLGVINVSGYEVPVYCLDDDLSVVKSIPDSRSVCVILKGHNCALLCKDIRVLDFDEMKEFDLPECMSHQYMPVSKICIYRKPNSPEDKVSMLVSSENLEVYIAKNSR